MSNLDKMKSLVVDSNIEYQLADMGYILYSPCLYSTDPADGILYLNKMLSISHMWENLTLDEEQEFVSWFNNEFDIIINDVDTSCIVI